MNITEVVDGRFVADIKDDEMSWSLYEGFFTPPRGGPDRRYRVEYILRTVGDDINPKLHAFVTDLGSRELDTYPPIRIMCYGTDTVGEVRTIAFLTRSDHKPELPESAAHQDTFGADAQANLERKREKFLGRTTFGYGKSASLEQRDRG